MTAPQLYPLTELTPAEVGKLTEFEAAPYPAEVLREQAAAAAWLADNNDGVPVELHYDASEWAREHETSKRTYRVMADAALAVFRGQQDERVQRVVAELHRLGEYYDGTVLKASTAFHSSAALVRAALAGGEA